jgi:hypothetical protein
MTCLTIGRSASGLARCFFVQASVEGVRAGRRGNLCGVRSVAKSLLTREVCQHCNHVIVRAVAV